MIGIYGKLPIFDGTAYSLLMGDYITPRQVIEFIGDKAEHGIAPEITDIVALTGRARLTSQELSELTEAFERGAKKLNGNAERAKKFEEARAYLTGSLRSKAATA